MKRTTGVTLVLGALAAAGAMEIAAQEPAAERRPGRRGPAVEAIMQMRDRLELTDEQVAQLDEIRRADVERRSAEWAEMAEMRSRLAAGQIRRSDMMRFMEERRDASVDVAEQNRARIDAVLTEDQLGALEEVQSRARARVDARRGPRGQYRPGRGISRSRDGFRRSSVRIRPRRWY